jgi:hypothetical protein
MLIPKDAPRECACLRRRFTIARRRAFQEETMSRNANLKSAFVVASVLSIFVPAPTQAIDLPVEGGPGGGPFRIKCDGGFVAGFEGRTGAFIDHMRILCSPWDGNARKLLSPTALPITLGKSGGGGAAKSACPTGWALFEINFQNTWRDEAIINTGFVHHINFKCAPPTGPETIWRLYGTDKPVAKPSGFLGEMLLITSNSVCPPGQFAVGMHGRAGGYVDALGLICEPMPAAAPPPPPQAAAPAAPPPQAAAPAPPPQATPTQADKVAATLAGFTGTWNTKTDKNWTYVMTFIQDGREVNGTFVAQDGSKGRIKGRFGANVMEFNWEQDGGFTGTGRFALAADGNSFSGVYQANPHPKLTDPSYLQGSWGGTRR